MSTSIILMLLGGLTTLVIGGELLIRGASKIAAALGVSSLVIGLTVVALGTSAPELVVSLKASLQGQSNLAMANVVGSNIFNVLLILGSCALFAPLTVSSQLIRLDVPVMVGASILTFIFASSGSISFWEGGVLVTCLIVYTLFLINKSRKEARELKSQEENVVPLSAKIILVNLLFIAIGLTLLIVGGEWFVTAAVEMAQALGVSDTVIGLTIVAAGTSLPEVAASLIATIKGERDMAIGNVIGSNIYNLMGILGITSLVTPGGIGVSTELLSFDLPFMLAVMISCLPIFIAGFKINRWEGALFFLSYILYTIFLVLNATGHNYFESYQFGLTYFILPAVLLTLGIITFQALQTIKQR